MKLEVGKCFVCGCDIVKDGTPMSNWQQIYYETDSDIIVIGFCKECELTEDTYEMAILALNESLKSSYRKVVQEIKRESMIDFKRRSQKNKCATCGAELGDTFANSGHSLTCECCFKVNTPSSFDAHSTPGRIAREYNQKHPREAKSV